MATLLPAVVVLVGTIGLSHVTHLATAGGYATPEERVLEPAEYERTFSER